MHRAEVVWTPERVREVLDASGLLVCDFARAIGVHKWSVHAWLSGKASPGKPARARLNLAARRWLSRCPVCCHPLAAAANAPSDAPAGPPAWVVA